jgi:hypothetical protein
MAALKGGDFRATSAAALGHAQWAVDFSQDMAFPQAAAAADCCVLLLPGAYYVEKRYTEAADAYSKSLAIFDMIDDVSWLLDGVEQPGASRNCGASCSGVC